MHPDHDSALPDSHPGGRGVHDVVYDAPPAKIKSTQQNKAETKRGHKKPKQRKAWARGDGVARKQNRDDANCHYFIYIPSPFFRSLFRMRSFGCLLCCTTVCATCSSWLKIQRTKPSRYDWVNSGCGEGVTPAVRPNGVIVSAGRGWVGDIGCEGWPKNAPPHQH